VNEPSPFYICRRTGARAWFSDGGNLVQISKIVRFNARFRGRAARAAVKVFRAVHRVHGIFSQRRSLHVHVTSDNHLSVGETERFELIDPNGVKSRVVVIEGVRRLDRTGRYVVTSRLGSLDSRDERILDEAVSIHVLIFEIFVARGSI
jgi:hypothetical protein